MAFLLLRTLGSYFFFILVLTPHQAAWGRKSAWRSSTRLRPRAGAPLPLPSPMRYLIALSLSLFLSFSSCTSAFHFQKRATLERLSREWKLREKGEGGQNMYPCSCLESTRFRRDCLTFTLILASFCCTSCGGHCCFDMILLRSKFRKWNSPRTRWSKLR